MNKNQYRLIFNRARNMMMAVAECVKSHNSGNSKAAPNLHRNIATPCTASQSLALRPLTFSVFLALGMVGIVPNPLSVVDAHADIIADTAAPANQRPLVSNTANGVPLVNIQAPSAAGVSRNTYTQFDVNNNGVILNNSRTNVQTQLGGFVQGNPNMAAGTARIILNEVNSQTPSFLNGYIEVAGSRAQVIIANPAGISCSGCGFINTSRATLTTGTPVFGSGLNGGDLMGYRVGGGDINFLGAGLDASSANYTDVLARAVNLNAGMWAQHLNIVTGTNQINVASNGDISAIALIAPTSTLPSGSASPAPTLAIDVAALGGMYAGKIHLVGTEAGVGVRNAGSVGASTGSLTIDVNGMLTNAENGRMISQQETQIHASQGLDNAGVIYASANATLTTQGNLANMGTIAAEGNATLNANGINSSISSNANSVLAAGLNADGTLANGTLGSTGNLTLSATQSITALGQNLAAQDQTLTAQTLDLTGSQAIGRHLMFTASNGSLNATSASINASGALSVSATQMLTTDGAAVSASQLNLAAQDLSNVAGELSQTSMGNTNIILAGNLNNNQGRIATNSNNLVLTAQTLTNTDGSIEHAGNGTLTINATTLDGSRGVIASNGNLDLTAQTATLDAGSTIGARINIDTTTLSNRQGEIIQSGTGNSRISASSNFDNTNGIFASNGSTTLVVDNLNNQGGNIQVAGVSNLTLNATGSVDNTAAGVVTAGGFIDINAGQLRNVTGEITAADSLMATVTQAFNNNQGLLAANQHVTVTAASIDNSQGTIASVQANIAAAATTGAINNTAGRIQAAQHINLSSHGLNNTDGVVSGVNVNLNSGTQALDNTGGSIAALGTLDSLSGQVTNDAGLIQAAGSMSLNTQGQALININSGTTGGIIGQSTVALTTGALNNQSGFIGAENQLIVNSAAMTNTLGGIITSESDVSLTGTSLDNRTGQVEALGNVTVDVGNGTVDNTASSLRAGQTLSIAAGNVVNANTLGAGHGLDGQNVYITANQINNSIGAIRANDTLTLTGHGAINNAQGLISSRHTLTIADSNLSAKAQAITNTDGTLIASANLQIDSVSLTGDGKVLSQGDFTANLTGNYTQTSTGELQADGNLSLTTSGNVTNQSGILAGNTLTLNAANIDNTATGEISGLNTYISTTNMLTNRGLIDGNDTFITATTLNNIGTGSLFGDHVAITANTLNNNSETLSGITSAAVIAARNQLDIGAQIITNQNNSLLFSAGDMGIGGSLDANHTATVAAGQAQVATLTNRNATVEALGNLTANVTDLQNLNGGITTQTVFVGSTAYHQFTPRGTSVILNAADYPAAQIGNFNISWRNAGPYTFREYYRYLYTGTTTQEVVQTSLPAQLLSGGHMTLNGNITNSDSKIIAGGLLNITGASLNNANTAGQATTSYSGTLYYYDYDGDESCGDPGDGCYDISASAYNPASNVTTFNLPTTEVVQLTAPLGTGTQISTQSTTSVNQTVTAASAATSQVNTISTAPVVTTVTSTSSVDGQTVNSLIGTASPNTVVSSNSLFQTNPNPNNNYLIETNPRFANYSTWLSSDYMLNQLSYDPATQTQRLGDGFYEQRLIREQVNQLTGQRFLAGYSSDEAQYQALMQNGITSAKAFNLTPGIALSAAQIAQLTSDIVWLVSKEATLPAQYDANGKLIKAASTTQALVPQVYARLREGDLQNTGSLLAGQSVKLNVAGNTGLIDSGTLTNQGSISSRTLVAINSNNIDNLGGVISGKQVQLDAVQDPSTGSGGSINNIGGNITAQNSLQINADRDIKIESTTQSSQNSTGASTFTRTNIDRVAGLYVTGDAGTLVAQAGRDIIINAAQIQNDSSHADSATFIQAGNDMTLSTVQIAEQNNSIRNTKNYLKHGSTQEIGTTIQATSDITLIAGNDLNAKAANITSQDGALTGIADNSITIESGTQTSNMATARHTKKSGSFSSKKTTTRDTYNDTNSIASNFSAETINLQSGNDIGITGSNIVATNDVNLNASNNISIESAQETHTETHYKKVKQSGLSSSGASVTYGKSSLKTTNDTQSTTNVASTVGSVEGNVNINASKVYTQTGSDVLTPQGDINIAAQSVTIQNATDTYASQQTMKYKQSGLTLAASSSALNLAQNVASTAQGTIKSDGTGNKMLNALQTYANTSTLIEQKNAIVSAAKAGDAQGAADAAGVRVSISIGSSKASSASTTNATVSQESLLKAGGDISIKATQDNINVVGSEIKSAQNVTLDAAKDINLIASADTEANLSKNKSSSASIGVSFGVGKNTGFSVDVAASRGKGNANSNSTTYNNTQVSADEKLNLKSGNDTNLIGANISGKQVIANIGGDLNMESLQDTATSKAKQTNTSVGVSTPVGPGAGGGSFSQSKQKSNSNYASVYEQTSIKAGNEGFNINTQGNTDLKGAVIASEASADKNQLTTGTLATSKIQNHMDAKASSSTTGLSTDMLSSKYALAKGVAGNLLNNGKANISDDSTTLSAIASANIAITDKAKQQALTGQTVEETAATLNRDTTHTNRVLAKPDVEALQKEVQKQQADNMLLLNTVTALADDGIKKLSNPKLYKVFCTQEPCRNDQQANNKLIGEIALDIFINNPGMSAEDATKLAIEKITGPGGNSSMADPQYAGSDPNRVVKVDNPITGEQGQRILNIQILPTTLGDLAALPNDQKQNSTVFANGIFNDLQRGAELATQQTPTFDPNDLAQLQRMVEAGNVAVGDTYLVHTDKANNFIGELIVAGIEKQAEIWGVATPAASLKANAIQTLSTNNATGSTDNTVFSVAHSRGTMTDSAMARFLGSLNFYNPNLQFIEDNPAAQQARLEGRTSQITVPQNLYIWAPSHDPVATFVGGYGDNYVGSLVSVPSVFTTSNSVHSSPGTGAVGSLTTDVNKPISYVNIDVDQLNQARAQQTQDNLTQLFNTPKTSYIAPQIDQAQQLQQQNQQQNNAQMKGLLQNSSNKSQSVHISSDAYQKLIRLKNTVNGRSK